MSGKLRKILWGLVPVSVLVAGAEVGLRLWGPDYMADYDLALTANAYDGAWVQSRDRHLGPPLYRVGSRLQTNPIYAARGMHRLNEWADARIPTLAVLGGSAANGIPFDSRGPGFTELAARRVNEGNRLARLRVWNLAVPGMDSRAYPQMARDALAVGADAIYIYGGNNELSGTLYEGCVGEARLATLKLADRSALLGNLRRLVRHQRSQELPDIGTLAASVDECKRQYARDTQLDEVGGIPATRRSPAYRDAVDTWSESLDEVARITQRAGVPLWISPAAVDQTWWPEMALLPPASAGQQPQVDAEIAALRKRLEAGEDVQAEARALVDRWPALASAHHLLGMALREAGQPDAARPHLDAGNTYDLISRRALPEVVERALAVCDAWDHVECIDVRGALAAASPDGIVDSSLMVDYCHLDWEEPWAIAAEPVATAVMPWAHQSFIDFGAESDGILSSTMEP